jgi:hypothetical protein
MAKNEGSFDSFLNSIDTAMSGIGTTFENVWGVRDDILGTVQDSRDTEATLRFENERRLNELAMKARQGEMLQTGMFYALVAGAGFILLKAFKVV